MTRLLGLLFAIFASIGLAGATTAATSSYDYDVRANLVATAQYGADARTTPPDNTRTDAELARAGPRTVARSSTSRMVPRRAAKGGSKFIGPVRQSSDQIGNGHEYGKHVVERGEFRHIEGVVSNPTASKGLSNGRSAFYDARSNTVVIRDPRSPDGGTAFRPSAGQSGDGHGHRAGRW